MQETLGLLEPWLDEKSIHVKPFLLNLSTLLYSTKQSLPHITRRPPRSPGFQAINRCRFARRDQVGGLEAAIAATEEASTGATRARCGPDAERGADHDVRTEGHANEKITKPSSKSHCCYTCRSCQSQLQFFLGIDLDEIGRVQSAASRPGKAK